MNSGKIYFVATPIGNLADLSERAKQVLSSVDLVVCEDTRITGRLLEHLGLKKPLLSLNQHSADQRINQVLCEVKDGKNIAYLSDSGTPGISDPGQKFAYHARSFGLNVIPVPGPSALTAAIAVSGLVEKEFYFAGFLPKKKGRESKLRFLAALDCPVVIYESALRVVRTLQDLKRFFTPDSQVFIAREMTKKFEEYWGGELESVIDDLGSHNLKGELVIIIKKKCYFLDKGQNES